MVEVESVSAKRFVARGIMTKTDNGRGLRLEWHDRGKLFGLRLRKTRMILKRISFTESMNVSGLVRPLELKDSCHFPWF